MDYTTWSKSAVQWIINKCKAVFVPKTQFYDGFLGWGGKALADSVSPVDAAMSDQHSANRFAFAKAAGVKMEYSRDGGATYTDYGADAGLIVAMLTGGMPNFYTGGRAREGTEDDTLRITLNASAMGVYTRLRKLLICVSNQGSVGVRSAKVVIEVATIGAPDTYRVYRTYSVAGWSGWNSIPIDMSFGGSSTQTGQTANIRLTFKQSNLYSGGPNLAIVNIFGFGENAWRFPSQMARTGHLYDYDMAQNAKFPAGVSATTFNGHTLLSDVPANAKFTDTTYGVATSSADGLMAKADKAKLDGFGQAADYAKTADVSRKQDKALRFTNISVPTSAWKTAAASSCDGVRTKYANVPLSGVTADMVPQVVFPPVHIESFNLSPIVRTIDGGIQIYAETAPTGAITIPTILCWR